jgi:GT2 family glycosyltransferase
VDQGSRDGTVTWLKSYQPAWLREMPENVGISRGSNIALDAIFLAGYDLIMKMDNDCLVQSDNILGQLVEIFSDVKEFQNEFVLSPKVDGIRNQPERGRYVQLGGRRIGLTAIVGGLFHVVPAKVYRQYRYPEKLPRGAGQDDDFCDWVKQRGCEVGYIEGLVVEHMETTDGQYKMFPDYFQRKDSELKEDSETVTAR